MRCRYHHKLRSGRQALPAKFDELRNYLPKAEACAAAAKLLPVPVGVMIAANDAVIMPFQVEATAAYFGVEAIMLEGAAHDLQLVSVNVILPLLTASSASVIANKYLLTF